MGETFSTRIFPAQHHVLTCQCSPSNASSGFTAIEYALIAALMVVAAIAAIA